MWETAKKEATYLWIKPVQGLNSLLNLALMDRVPDLLASLDGGVLLPRREVGLFRKLGGSQSVSFHGQVVQNQVVDIAVEIRQSSAW